MRCLERGYAMFEEEDDLVTVRFPSSRAWKPDLPEHQYQWTRWQPRAHKFHRAVVTKVFTAAVELTECKECVTAQVAA